VSGENLKIFIGGGAGVYFGNRTRIIAGNQSKTIDNKPGYSLNVLSGIEYYLVRNLSALFEFKFRDAYFEVESQFGSGQNPFFGLPNPFKSRIVVNGTVFSLGLKYNF
jgi:opacity protein-like surface antigen